MCMDSKPEVPNQEAWEKDHKHVQSLRKESIAEYAQDDCVCVRGKSLFRCVQRPRACIFHRNESLYNRCNVLYIRMT